MTSEGEANYEDGTGTERERERKCIFCATWLLVVLYTGWYCHAELQRPWSVPHVPHAGRQTRPKQQHQEQEQRTPSPLSLLPTDLLGQVLERIQASSVARAATDPSRLSARTACRWLRDAYDSCNTHLVLVGAAATAGSKGSAAERRKGSAQRRSYHALLQRLIARTSSLSSLRIKDWENSRELLKLPVAWGQIKVLDLSGLQYQDPYSASGKPKLQAFGPLTLCSALEELVTFCGCLFACKPGTLPFRSTLRSLCLLRPSNSDIDGIAPLFTALQQLELKGCSDRLDIVSIAACTELRQLSLELHVFENVNGSVSSLTSLTALTSLAFRECGNLNDLQPIALLSSLRQLELRGAYCITDISPLGSLRSSLERLVMTGGSFAGSEACLSSCTLLSHLDLSCCLGGGGVFDLSALSACILLEHLDLGHCPVTGSLEPLLPCTRLQRLLLSGCRVNALAPLTSLRKLDLSYCNKLRDLSQLTACISLSGLDVSHCPRIKSIAPLAACKQLQVLRLRECVNITNLKPITACVKLAWLGLNGCSGIKSLAPLSACRVLEVLHLGECNSLASLEPLQACTALEVLGLNHLAKPISLAPLAACPSLQKLDLHGCCSSMNLAPLQSCSNLQKLFLTGPLYQEALHYLSHLKNLSIMNKPEDR